ncbi:unnamed protein product [Umbelopsis sp. WA50703]
MNRTPKPTSSSSNKKQLKKQQQPQANTAEQANEPQQTSTVQSNLNPEKMQQIQDKVQELEHLLKIKDMSGQMANYFDELAKSVEGLAGGAQAVSDVLSNWNHVFRTMSMVSPRQHENEEKDSMEAEDMVSSLPKQDCTQEPPVLVRMVQERKVNIFRNLSFSTSIPGETQCIQGVFSASKQVRNEFSNTFCTYVTGHSYWATTAGESTTV